MTERRYIFYVSYGLQFYYLFFYNTCFRKLSALSLQRQSQCRHHQHPATTTDCQAVMMPTTRRNFFGMAGIVTTTLLTSQPSPVYAFSTRIPASATSNTELLAVRTTTTTPVTSTTSPSSTNPTTVVAYKTIPLPLTGFGINAPVAMWYPVTDQQQQQQSSSSFFTKLPSSQSVVKYDYQISVKRIGELLARWDFIPGFVTRKFSFERNSNNNNNKDIQFVNGSNIPLPSSKAKVVVLTHGFLGSRFDLSHIAEDLAAQGFVCLAPEYPESLEASYPRIEGLDRKVVNDRLLQWIDDTIPEVSSFASIGHSMGAGTALDIGDDSWNRVLMGIGRAPDLPGREPDRTAKFPLRQVGGRLLFISSVNDGAVKWGGGIRVPDDYTMLEESQIRTTNNKDKDRTVMSSSGRLSMMKIPDRAALVFDRTDAPNHISFLSENVNEAMISFLAPLLPIAQAFEIPVLDFDKYVMSRDSVQTAEVLIPLIAEFLRSTDRDAKQ